MHFYMIEFLVKTRIIILYNLNPSKDYKGSKVGIWDSA